MNIELDGGGWETVLTRPRLLVEAVGRSRVLGLVIPELLIS